MALFIDDKQINPRDFVINLKINGRYPIDERKYERIIKSPTFKLDGSKILKKRTINSPLAKKTTYGVMTSFWFKDESDGLMKKLRYAEAQIPKTEGGVRTFTYEPPRLTMTGHTVSFVNAPDKAVFMFLNPGNPTSPFAEKTKKKFAYMDKVEATLKAADDMSNIQKALTHATTMDEEELVIVAKGLKLLGSDDYDIDELRVQLQQFAINPQTNRRYTQAMDDDMVRIEGRIRNLVDKQVFKLTTRGATRQWVWDQGRRKGEYIGESLMNPNEDAMQRLMNHVKANLGDYLYDLRNSTEIFQADRKAREILKADKVKVKEPEIEVPEHLATFNAEPLSLKSRYTNFAEFRDFVGIKGYPKNGKLIKELMEGVLDGSVTDENVDRFLAKLFEK